MIDFYKNKLINRVLEEYYSTFSRTLDTCDYVPEKFNNKIYKYIFKNMKKDFKKIDKDSNLHFKLKKQNSKKRKKFLIIRIVQYFKYLYLKKNHRLLTYSAFEKKK